jgi:hypothetical protein
LGFLEGTHHQSFSWQVESDHRGARLRRVVVNLDLPALSVEFPGIVPISTLVPPPSRRSHTSTACSFYCEATDSTLKRHTGSQPCTLNAVPVVYSAGRQDQRNCVAHAFARLWLSALILQSASLDAKDCWRDQPTPVLDRRQICRVHLTAQIIHGLRRQHASASSSNDLKRTAQRSSATCAPDGCRTSALHSRAAMYLTNLRRDPWLSIFRWPARHK